MHLPPLTLWTGGTLYQPQPGSRQLLAFPCHSRAEVSGRRIKGEALILLLPPTTTKQGSTVALRVPRSPQHPAGGWHVTRPAPRATACPELRGTYATGSVLSQEVCLRGEAAARSSLWVSTAAFIIYFFLLLLVGVFFVGLVFWGFFCRGQTDLVGWIIFFFLCVTFVSF